MPAFSNAQILAAVVTEWSRPAVSQLTASKLCQLPSMQEVQQQLVASGLVGTGYRLQSELSPFIAQVAPQLIEPMLTQMFSRIPDATIPQVARTVVNTAMQQPNFSVLDGLITFDREDLQELLDLIELNLPLADSSKSYKLKRK